MGIIDRIYNDHLILKKIGEGGMGKVYLAQNSMGIKVAIKTLKPELAKDPKMLSRFRNECQALIRLEGHPNIVQIRSVGNVDGLPCLIMEYLEGGMDLNSYITHNGAVSDEVLLRNWLMQILSALDYAHDLSPRVIHRDIKPSNLFLTKFGQIKLLDFGIVKVIEESSDPDVTLKTLTSTTSKLGSISYMSPEQTFDSKLVDERSDIYSLGKTLKALMTAGNPFVKVSSEPFKTIIEKSTLDHPDERFQNCKEILQLLLKENNNNEYIFNPSNSYKKEDGQHINVFFDKVNTMTIESISRIWGQYLETYGLLSIFTINDLKIISFKRIDSKYFFIILFNNKYYILNKKGELECDYEFDNMTKILLLDNYPHKFYYIAAQCKNRWGYIKLPLGNTSIENFKFSCENEVHDYLSFWT